MNTTWSEKVIALEAAGWTLTALAGACGKSVSWVSDIKQGRTKEPGGMAAVRLHNLFSTGAQPPDRAPAKPEAA